MINKILTTSLLLAAFSVPTFAATAAAGFYVAQDAKTHMCAVSDQKPDGKSMMDAGTKVYANKGNAEQAMANLKACAASAAVKAAVPATPAVVKAAAPAAAVVATPAAAMAAGFYVEQDTKSHKCAVDSKKPDGKAMIDVGTKIYKTQGSANQAMSMLKACKA